MDRDIAVDVHDTTRTATSTITTNGDADRCADTDRCLGGEATSSAAAANRLCKHTTGAITGCLNQGGFK